MTLKTLMVHLEVGRSNAGVLRIASEMATRFDAGLVGIAVAQPLQLIYGDGYVTGEVVQQDRDTIDQGLKAAQAEFRAAFQDHARSLDWRTCVTFGPLSDYIARESRSADLVLTGVTGAAAFSATRGVNAGDLVMQTGRPVLLAPVGVNSFSLKRVIVAWKDTREARRAALDALPLLQAAEHVTVLGIAAQPALEHVRPHLEDVVGWLKSHGVAATAHAVACSGDEVNHLRQAVKADGANLIVAGAYGHNRLREWALGGLTRDLLLCDDLCVFLSH